MILEALEHWLTPCPRPWKRMGYLREQLAIDARLRRNRKAWEPHLLASREFILKAARTCVGRDRVLILGAGLQHDLPLQELGSLFREVILADLVIRPRCLRQVRRLIGGALRTFEFDATGVLSRVYAEADSLSPSALKQLVLQADPGLPPGISGEPDLIVSANLASQLMLLPAEWVERFRELEEGELEALKALALRAHLAWLSRRPGCSVLISDTERRLLPNRGGGASSEPSPGFDALRPCDEEWLWRIAPIPEYSAAEHLEFRVQAWAGQAGAFIASERER